MLIKLLYYFKNLDHVYGITINFVLLTYEDKDTYLEGLENDFNKYSRENDLDIIFKREAFSTTNITLNVVDYGEMIESLLKKPNSPYDMFMVDAVYTRRYSKYAADLKNYLSNETLDKYYINGLASKTGIYKDKLVGVPLFIDTGALFSTRRLLDKYNKRPPKTWDELIETAEDIMTLEKKEGNDDLIGYLGNFPKEETAICSATEFLYSFRENIDDKLPPDYLSKNALDALNKLKEIQDKVSSGIYIYTFLLININVYI
ncbi:hypothetical protein PIROE2DRAFT_9453 [Piromyces sp. E2]|nr:hypothetical protein PIROE2DRAFT_9453 [Piromyces sp. E2]|eukprot:OUM63922.1 hypothetical protein PIROE2DRAFT_9453 [Piromyces sp. E2]